MLVFSSDPEAVSHHLTCLHHSLPNVYETRHLFYLMKYDPVTEKMHVLVLVLRLLLSMLAVMNSREANGIKLTLNF